MHLWCRFLDPWIRILDLYRIQTPKNRPQGWKNQPMFSFMKQRSYFHVINAVFWMEKSANVRILPQSQISQWETTIQMFHKSESTHNWCQSNKVFLRHFESSWDSLSQIKTDLKRLKMPQNASKWLFMMQYVWILLNRIDLTQLSQFESVWDI